MRGVAVRRAVTAILGLAGVWFLLTRSSDLLAAVSSVASLGPEILPLGLGLVAFGVLSRGTQARHAFRLVGLPVPLAPMVALSASSYATGKVVKSGGAAGLLPFLADAPSRGHSRAKVVAAYISMKLAEAISLCALITVTVLAGVVAGDLHGAVLYGAMASLAYAIVISVTLIVLARNRSTADTAGKIARQIASHTRRLLRRPEPEDKPSIGYELGDALARFRSDPRSAVPLVASAAAGKVIGGACLALVLSGFGARIGLITVALFYTLTLMAAMIGPLPGGIGVAEASLGAMLISAGVPAHAAAAAVVAFRLLDLWLPLLAGALAGLAYSRRRSAAPVVAPLAGAPSIDALVT